jgi:hypothetical protein
MADDHNQRAYRGSDLSSRGAGAGGSSGNDPLAELARLIGQTDPFAEYGRNNAQRAPTVPGQQAPAWPDDTSAYPADEQGHAEQKSYADQPYGGFGREAYGSKPLSADSSQLYQVDAHAPGYAPQGYEADPYANGPAAGYDQAFPPSQEPLHDVHQQFGPAPSDDYYDDVAPSRRRISVLAIAGVFALAILGTAGALGYRAVFGPSSAPSVPPVIKAEATPSKVVPATASKDPGKVTDRVGGNGQIERLLSREEQPVPVVTTPNQSAPAANALNSGAAGSGTAAPAMGSGVVGEPRKIRTIQIRPDQSADSASAAPAAASEPAPSAAQPPVRVVNVAPVAEPPARVAPQPEPSRPVAQPPRNVTPQAAAPAPQPAAQPSHAPLSLNPNAQPARPAAPARVAAQTPAPQAAAPASGGYAVQVSAQRSEAEAQAAFQSLQGKFPSQLGGRAPFIKRVDLGDKGIYYRAMVIVGSNSEAGELCSSLKAAGGSCIIQRN